MSNIATRLLVDLKRERRMRAEVAAFDKELKAAVASKDKDKQDRLKKRKPQMDQMRLKASSGRFKVVHRDLAPVHHSLLPDGRLRQRVPLPFDLRLRDRRLLAAPDPVHRCQRVRWL